MDFQDYIQSLKKDFKLVKINDHTYILHKNKKTLELTPDKMYNIQEINDILNVSYPDISYDRNLEDLGSKNKGILNGFGNVGEDDLHPQIGRRKGKKKGAIFSPEEFKEEEDSDGIDKTDIFPLKKKRDPDSDHFKKTGGDDDNPFLY
ncbi:proteasome inhibitor PI31L [Vairimorpha necatrix]|uniref:Proteasome inhibitor PI31L n=1 Tax=Vairimorpha necatrix TaxID=6039 RepID=A0AAX4JDQ6_9MICR|nr:Chain 3, Proteasome Inhibitor 31-Like [Vairimorpha necatrix]8ADN_4 Chain 4, Proteasome Inhibitor 31-Like [Vairimorpha necatrix]